MSGRRLGLTPNLIRPTEKQISTNTVVIPKAFRNQHSSEIDWNCFSMKALGVRYADRSLDNDGRVGVPMRGRISHGSVLSLEIVNGELNVESVKVE